MALQALTNLVKGLDALMMLCDNRYNRAQRPQSRVHMNRTAAEFVCIVI